jgi:UPF0716 protein FxsA
MPLWALALVFLLVPVAELYVIYKVGDAIGVLPTFLLLALDSVLGALLLRAQGRAVWRRFNEAMASGRIPHREVIDGVLVIFGGAFLLTPGFITDIIGVVFLLPPTRALVRRFLVKRFADRMIVAAQTRATGWPPPGSGRRPGDVDGTAIDVDADHLPRGTA